MYDNTDNNTLVDDPLLLAMTVYPIYISGHKGRQKHHLSFKSTAKRSVEKTPTTDLQQLRREKILKSVSKVSETRTTARKKIQNTKKTTRIRPQTHSPRPRKHELRCNAKEIALNAV